MRNHIYLDNASTSFPKPEGVTEAVNHYIADIGCNVGRGGYAPAFDAADVVWETRERLCSLLGFGDPHHVVFTGNVTQSLNMLLKGLLRSGDHVLVTAVEHNALMRPLVQLEKQGVCFDRIPCDSAGQLQLEAVAPLIRPSTRAIFMLHASNVTGAVQPVAEVGAIAKAHGLYLVVDAAQTAGCFDIDMAQMGIDALAFTGHKSLLGPQGIGGFVVSAPLAKELTPWVSGGTGSMSDSEEVPDQLPDRFEAGTLNLPGIFGLHAALGYLQTVGIATIRERELALARRLEAGLKGLPGLRLIGPADWTRRAPIVSIDCVGQDNAQVAFRLADEHRILTRCGLHCAPSAHRALGTFPQGTVRFSVSHFNTEAHVDLAIAAMGAIIGKA